jgi:hypothetical protein
VGRAHSALGRRRQRQMPAREGQPSRTTAQHGLRRSRPAVRPAVIAKSALTPGSADFRGAATRRWQLTDAWTVDPRLLPGPASRSRPHLHPTARDCASQAASLPRFQRASGVSRSSPSAAARALAAGGRLEVPLRAAAVPPPTPSLQLGHRDPPADLLGRPMVTQHIWKHRCAGIPAWSACRRTWRSRPVSAIACLAGLGGPSTTNSGASAGDLRPRSDCQSG